MSDEAVVVEKLSHYYGVGELRRQVLFEVSVRIAAGEIVILTGPSGSGKTTLLTLIGALRSAQTGSLRVLGHELRGASEPMLAGVRQRIGYVFQAHNLLESLSARQNVRMTLELDRALGSDELDVRATAALDAVGLADRADAHPSELSGGQRQRVAIARALVRRPALLLADEPTASLDKVTGHAIVEILQRLARRDGVTVVLVTHDPRILDLADRILTLEDGRLSSLMNVVASDAGQMLRSLALDIRRGELVGRVGALDASGFSALLDRVTEETHRLLELVDLIQGQAFEGMLEQVLDAFSAKLAELFHAERATLFLVDDEARELWSFGRAGPEVRREVRASLERGVAGRAARSARPALVPVVADEPLFDPAIDGIGGTGATSLLAVPATDSHGRVFAVAVLVRGGEAPAFTPSDQTRLVELTGSLGAILESWWRMSCACRARGLGSSCPCCGGPWHPRGAPRLSSATSEHG